MNNITKNKNSFGSLPIYSNDYNEQSNEKIAIFLDKYSNNEILTNDNDYISTLRFWYMIPHPFSLHKQLISEGYFEKSDLNHILINKTLVELKKIANETNIKVAGKKADIISQLCENMDDYNKQKMIKNSKLYMLSKKGNDFLNNYSDFIVLAENYMWNINMDDLKKYRNKYGESLSVYKIAEKILINEINHNLVCETSNSSYTICISLAKLYDDMNNIYESTKYYLGLLLISINFGPNQNSIFPDIYKKTIYEAMTNNDYNAVPSTITKIILKRKELLSNELIFSAYDSVKNSCCIYLKKEEFFEMIKELINNNKVNQKKYLEIIYSRIK